MKQDYKLVLLRFFVNMITLTENSSKLNCKTAHDKSPTETDKKPILNENYLKKCQNFLKFDLITRNFKVS